MSKVKAAEAMMDVFVKWGIRRVYGLPGDSIDTTIDALHVYEKEIDFVQVRHEEVASLAATAEAKLTGNVGVCLSIGGPGAVHLLNGLYDAKMDHAPVLALVGQIKSNLLNTHFFQEVDLPEMFRDVAVYNKLVQSGESLPRLADEAIRTAIKEQGVAVLTIPDNIGDEVISDVYRNIVGQTNLFNPPAIPRDKIAEAVALLKDSKRPIVLAGTGARGCGASLTRFIEENHIPIVQTVPAKGIVADDHPNSLGNVGKLGTKPAYEAMKEADLILLLGTNYPYKDYLPNRANCRCIQVDIRPTQFGNRFPVDVAIEGTVADFLAAISEKGIIRSHNGFVESCRQLMKVWNSWMAELRVNRKGNVIHPAFLMDQIEKIAKPDAIYTIDVGTITSWGARFLRVQPTQKYLLSSWFGTMGCALPYALGAKCEFPGRQVISIAGDGAFAMVMQDFMTAVKYNLPFVQFVLNNQKLAFIEYEQQSAGQRNYVIDLQDADYCKMAEAMGGVAYTVRTPEELETLMPQLADVKAPTLVNVYVADDAPLPGKIVMDEAQGYAKFLLNTLLKDGKIPEMPPMKEVLRQFF